MAVDAGGIADPAAQRAEIERFAAGRADEGAVITSLLMAAP
jgi:hypothetical protein